MKIPPKIFWAMSLIEWRAAIARPQARKPMTRSELENLMQQFPDA